MLHLEIIWHPIVRALTFFLDRQWGVILSTFYLQFFANYTSDIWVIIVTLTLTIIVGVFEKWMNGNLDLFAMFVQEQSNQSPRNVDYGVTTPPLDNKL
jgi:hypothetical protein